MDMYTGYEQLNALKEQKPTHSRRGFFARLSALAALPALRFADKSSTVYLIRGIYGSRGPAQQNLAGEAWRKCLPELINEKLLGRPKTQLAIKVDCSAPLLLPNRNVLSAFLANLFAAGSAPWKVTCYDSHQFALNRVKSVFTSKHGECSTLALRASAQNGAVATERRSDLLKLLSEQQTMHMHYGCVTNHRYFGYSGVLLQSALDFIDHPENLIENPEVMNAKVIESWRRHIAAKHVLSVLDCENLLYTQGPVGLPLAVREEQTLVAGNDPVAVDSIGLEFVNRRLSASGMATIKDDFLKQAEEAGLGARNPVIKRLHLE